MVRHRLNRIDPPLLLKDRFILETQVLLFPQHHFIFEELERKLQQYIQSGFVTYNTRDFDHDQNQKRYEEFREPFAVLTIDELEAGFIVCTIPFILSIFVFALEWMPTLKNLIIFWSIFKKYFEVVELEQSERIKLMKTKFAALQAAKQKQEREDAERAKVYELCCIQPEE